MATHMPFPLETDTVYTINNGPSKFDLMVGFFDRRDPFSTLNFRILDAEGKFEQTAKIEIMRLEHTNGKQFREWGLDWDWTYLDNSWFFGGEIVQAVNHQRQYGPVAGIFSAKNRQGKLRVIKKE